MMDRDYHREYSRNYYHKKKAILLELLGNKCVECSAVEDLEFDHIDPATKAFPISRLLNHRWAVTLQEVEKCQLLCKACHDEKTKCNKDGYDTRAKGENVASSKLTEAEVLDIKLLAKQAVRNKEIHKKYPHVTLGNIQAITGGISWQHLEA